jgi:hypothetical protein
MAMRQPTGRSKTWQCGARITTCPSTKQIMDHRKWRGEHAPIIIDGAVVEWVESFRFLGVHITNQLS